MNLRKYVAKLIAESERRGDAHVVNGNRTVEMLTVAWVTTSGRDWLFEPLVGCKRGVQ